MFRLYYWRPQYFRKGQLAAKLCCVVCVCVCGWVGGWVGGCIPNAHSMFREDIRQQMCYIYVCVCASMVLFVLLAPTRLWKRS